MEHTRNIFRGPGPEKPDICEQSPAQPLCDAARQLRGEIGTSQELIDKIEAALLGSSPSRKGDGKDNPDGLVPIIRDCQSNAEDVTNRLKFLLDAIA